MGKILALDLGNVWTGIAISDPLKIMARPYQTVATSELEHNLRTICDKEEIEAIVVGDPKTLRGTESQQTHQVRSQLEKLKHALSEQTFRLWDERLSSKRAAAQQPSGYISKEEKRMSHARAAAWILDTYLQAHYTLSE